MTRFYFALIYAVILAIININFEPNIYIQVAIGIILLIIMNKVFKR